jgi:hypothetical protein
MIHISKYTCGPHSSWNVPAPIRYNDNNTEYKMFLDTSLSSVTSEHRHNNLYMSNVTETGTPLFVVSSFVVYLRQSPSS